MSRVHDALRRAGQSGVLAASIVDPRVGPGGYPPSLHGLLERVHAIPYNPAPQALVIDALHPHEAATEEFRTLRTKLNHMQSLQPIHTAVVNLTLWCEFDLRRPIVHSLLQTDRGPGITDYLQGKVALHQAIRRVGDTNLYMMPAGEAVINPLELLNLKEVKQMLNLLPSLFNWVILDSPPLLFAADANLLSTLCHGTILVVRIGSTTTDSITRAMQSLCPNNVLGIIVNGARRAELYSRYTYYHSYSEPPPAEAEPTEQA
jgi:protein-tyrosine kinase